MAWTGTEVVVFGGSIGESARLDGAAWNPATNRWRTIAASPLTDTNQPVGAWLDGRLYAVNDTSAAAYDPETNRWASLPAAPIRPGWRSIAVAGGRVILIAFGDGRNAAGGVGCARSGVVDLAARRGADRTADGRGGVRRRGRGRDRADLAARSSTRSPPRGRRCSRCEGAGSGAVWTGSVVLGATGAWDTRTRTCLQVPPAPPREKPFNDTNGREFPAAVWTGTQYITWSGGTGGDIVWVPKDGAVFTPANDLGPCCG